MTLVSVVIPSRDRPRSLLRTLRSIEACEGSGELEVIVVDDGGAEPLEALLAGESLGLQLEVLTTDGIGLNPARNLGAGRATGSCLAFLDDDVSVTAGWVAGAGDFARSAERIAVAGGRVVAADPGAIPEWVSAEKMMYLSVVDLGSERRPFPPRFGPVGANLIVRRSWFERVGEFRPDLDRSGDSLISGGDTELCRRIEGAGGEILYWPGACVRHHLDPGRLSRSWFRGRALAQGSTDVITALDGARPGPGRLVAELIRPARAGGIFAKRLLLRRPLFDAELWLWGCRGRWQALRQLLAGGGAAR